MTARCDLALVRARERQLTWILVVAVCVLCLDQISKTVIRKKIPQVGVSFEQSQPTFFRFVHQKNRGLVGGMFQDHPRIAYTAPLIATVVLLYLFKHLDPGSKGQMLAYGMVAGGALGNLIDRFWHGGVIDFLQFHFYFIPIDFPWKKYPAFNVADSAICVGVFLLILGWGRPGKSDAADSV